MNTHIEGSPSFAYIQVNLEPGESVIAESDAMASMDGALDLDTKFNGGFLKGLLRKFLGGESLFVNHFTNQTAETRRITLVQPCPGDIHELELNGEEFCLQPGAYICSTPDVQLGLQWAGLRSGIAREGFFRLKLSGHGTVWYGAYGGMVTREIDGEYIIDTSHLVGYEPQIKLKLQLAGGLFSSFFGGEGLVTRVEGKGRIVIQTRSLSGLRDYLNPRI